MTDTVPPPSPLARGPSLLKRALDHLAGSGLVGRAAMLAVLTLVLKIPLSMVDGVIADRQSYETDAINNVRNSWGRSQTFVGPMIVLPYTPATSTWTRAVTLLPEKLAIDGKVVPEQRRRGLFAVTVYSTTFDVTAEFQTRLVRELVADGRWIDWSAARLTLGITACPQIPKPDDTHRQLGSQDNEDASADQDVHHGEYLPDRRARSEVAIAHRREGRHAEIQGIENTPAFRPDIEHRANKKQSAVQQ